MSCRTGVPTGTPAPPTSGRQVEPSGQTGKETSMGISVRNEGAKVNSDINVTPMVDVMLVLLIIFMVITPMLQNKVNIELAKVTDPTSMPDADKEDSVVVAITRDNKVYLGQNQVSMADLRAEVAD